jgi:GDPmannose 4,6-dehydratase
LKTKKLFRPNEIAEIYGNNSKAKEILDWNYNFSFYDVLDELIIGEIKNL